jgi:hypothetical protein
MEAEPSEKESETGRAQSGHSSMAADEEPDNVPRDNQNR